MESLLFVYADEDAAPASVLLHVDEVASIARRDRCVVAQIALNEPLLELTDRDRWHLIVLVVIGTRLSR